MAMEREESNEQLREEKKWVSSGKLWKETQNNPTLILFVIRWGRTNSDKVSKFCYYAII